MKKRFFIYYLPPIKDGITVVESWYIHCNKQNNNIELITPTGVFKGIFGVDMALRIYQKRFDRDIDKDILQQIENNCIKAKNIIVTLNQ